MWPNPQETADLVTFNEEIRNGKLHFLCSGFQSIPWPSSWEGYAAAIFYGQGALSTSFPTAITTFVIDAPEIRRLH